MTVAQIVLAEASVQVFRGGLPQLSLLRVDTRFSALGLPPPAILCHEDPHTEPLPAFDSHSGRGERASGSLQRGLHSLNSEKQTLRNRFLTSCRRVCRADLGAAANFPCPRHQEVSKLEQRTLPAECRG